MPPTRARPQQWPGPALSVPGRRLCSRQAAGVQDEPGQDKACVDLADALAAQAADLAQPALPVQADNGEEGSRNAWTEAIVGTDWETYRREGPGMSAFALEDGVVYHTAGGLSRVR